MLLAEADATGLPVRLEVLTGSKADRFYTRHGFVKLREDEIEGHYERPTRGQSIHALLPRGQGHQFVVYGDACSGVAGALHERTFAGVNAALRRLAPPPEFILFLGDEIAGYAADADTLVSRVANRAKETGLVRADDSAEVIRKRLDVYRELTEPLVNYYRGKGMLKTVDGIAVGPESGSLQAWFRDPDGNWLSIREDHETA